MAILTAAYVLLAIVLQLRIAGWAVLERQILQRIFDSMTFSTSMVLLIGLAHRPVLDAFGDTKPFLFFAGVLGVFYSVFALRPRAR
jgi:hypothetical protein